MLRIQPVVNAWVVSVRSAVVAIGRHDRNLSDQLSRSSMSVSMNLAEGAGATGGDKRRSYRIALREMREAMNALELASQLGFTLRMQDRETRRTDQIIGTLVRLARPTG